MKVTASANPSRRIARSLNTKISNTKIDVLASYDITFFCKFDKQEATALQADKVWIPALGPSQTTSTKTSPTYEEVEVTITVDLWDNKRPLSEIAADYLQRVTFVFNEATKTPK